MSIADGIEASRGNPLVVLALNVILSAAFVGMFLTLLDLIGAVDFTWMRFLGLTLVLVVITHVVTR